MTHGHGMQKYVELFDSKKTVCDLSTRNKIEGVRQVVTQHSVHPAYVKEAEAHISRVECHFRNPFFCFLPNCAGRTHIARAHRSYNESSNK